ASISHLTWSRSEFQAQVPVWVPFSVDFIVIASGVVEVWLGIALIVLPHHCVRLGWIVAAFFVAVFPGNVSQLVTGTDAFGLNTDTARAIRPRHGTADVWSPP
ncbi:MAG: DoxX superfamily protein, partial [Nocardioidaceae bacterium]|nr:DoxX superfamily protein [Nocardioidaceae bacterium]